MRWAAALVIVIVAACSDTAVMPPPGIPGVSPVSPTVETTAGVPPTKPAPPAEFSVARTLDTIDTLIAAGPREATSRAFRRAARIVARRFTALGYEVRHERFSVPSGVSWGVPVRAGSTRNVVAEPVGFDPTRDYVIVGGHLDTVPQAPGANDNASGVAIVLELARLAASEPPDVPIVFIAFGAEEPRGPGDDGHHYGAAHHATELSRARRRSLAGVLSIDRVGAGPRALICTGGRSPLVLRNILLRAANRLDHAARACDNRTSDHWPFERRGYTVARLDGGRFDGYHSARDTADRLNKNQLRRVGRIAWEGLRSMRGRDLN